MVDEERNNYKTISGETEWGLLTIEILIAAALILNGKVDKTLVKPALLNGAESWATTRGQEARLEAN